MLSSSSSSILAFFSNETKLKRHRPNSLNLYTVKRLMEEGREFKVFECKRKKGLSQENPLTRLYNKSILTKEEYHAGKDYCHHYQIANISHHARPSYDTAIGSTSPDKEFYTQSQFDASRKIAEAKNKIALFNIKKNNHRVYNLRYFEVLDNIFEREISIKVAEKNIGVNQYGIERKVKEICQILLK